MKAKVTIMINDDKMTVTADYKSITILGKGDTLENAIADLLESQCRMLNMYSSMKFWDNEEDDAWNHVC